MEHGLIVGQRLWFVGNTRMVQRVGALEYHKSELRGKHRRWITIMRANISREWWWQQWVEEKIVRSRECSWLRWRRRLFGLKSGGGGEGWRRRWLDLREYWWLRLEEKIVRSREWWRRRAGEKIVRSNVDGCVMWGEVAL